MAIKNDLRKKVVMRTDAQKYVIGSWSFLTRERLREHNSGVTTATKHRRPFKLIYFEGCLNEEDAIAREKYLKSGMGKRYVRNRLKMYFGED